MRCEAAYTDFSTTDYEENAARAGWSTFEWLPVTVSHEGSNALGDFWQGFEEDCPYVGFRTTKL